MTIMTAAQPINMSYVRLLVQSTQVCGVLNVHKWKLPGRLGVVVVVVVVVAVVDFILIGSGVASNN